MKAQDLVGTWRLRTWKNVGSDGSVSLPLGEQHFGYIFCSHDGYVSVEMMAAHRAPFQDPNPLGGSIAERVERPLLSADRARRTQRMNAPDWFATCVTLRSSTPPPR